MDTNTWQLLICLCALIWVVWLFLGYGTKSKSGADTKVHTLYLCGIGTLLIMELVIYVCLNGNADKKTIMDTVTFGATLSSLILSVVAIFFTLSSGRDNDKTLGRIEGALRRLDSTADSLSKFPAIVEEISKKSDKLHKRIEDLHQFEENKWNKHFDNDNQVFIYESNSGEKMKGLKEKDEQNMFEFFISRSSYMGILGLLACSYSDSSNQELNLNELAKAYKKEDLADYFLGYLVACACIKLVDIKFKNNIIKISKIYEKTEELCMKRVARQIENARKKNDTKYSKGTLDFLNILRKFFGLEEYTLEQVLELYSRQ